MYGLKAFTKTIRVSLALLLIIVGASLLIINALGFYYYTSIDNKSEYLLLNDRRTISKKEFLSLSYKKKNETTKEYVNRLNNLVSNYMLIIKHKYCKPTIFENWILYFYAEKLGFYEWSDTEKAVQLGGGYCSQHALLLNNILQSNGIESRILASKGHILNEVKIDNKWIVIDPTYNVILNYSLKELEGHPQRVYQIYKSSIKNELAEPIARYMEKLFENVGSHRIIKNTQEYRQPHHNIEKKSFYLIWFIPLILIILGIAILKGLPHNELPK